MTPEQIEQWAREAGLAQIKSHTYPTGVSFWTGWTVDLTRFAELVAQAERERCASVCHDEARIRTEAGQAHPAESESRGRCYAAARAAINCAKGCMNGEEVDAIRNSKQGGEVG